MTKHNQVMENTIPGPTLTDELAIKGPEQLIPIHLQSGDNRPLGREAGVDRDDLLIPRLAISQALSPQLKKSQEEYIPDLEAGQFFNSVTGEVYGEDVTVVPLFFFKQFIQFKPITEGGGIVKMYNLGEQPPVADLAFIDGKQPLVTEFKNRMSLLLGADGITPIVVSFKSTGMKTAKKWNNLIAEKRQAGLEAFAFMYRLKIVTKTKGSQEWFGCTVERSGFTPEGLYNSAKDYFTQLQAAGVQVDTSGIEQEVREPVDSEPAPF